MEKPSTGWLHDDSNIINGDGVFYAVKYIGSIPMGMSMSQMNFDQRTDVTREAITRCCEAEGLFPPTQRQAGGIVQQALPQHIGPIRASDQGPLNVKLFISIKGLTIVHIESDQPVGMHIMPSISFATGGGNPEDAQVIGYVAKDELNARNVYVFDCGGQAEDIIATMGQGFELRYKAFLKKGNQAAGAPPPAAGGALYGDASNYGDASPYGDGSGGVYGADNYGDASGGGGGGGGGETYGGDSLYDTAAANDGGVYGDDAIYDEAAGAGGVYGDDALYDEAAGSGAPTYDTAANATSGYLDTAPGPN